VKKAKLVEQLKWVRKCAEEAGIYHAMFLGYGTCLGAVRDKGIIGGDGDADVCFLADKFDKAQEDAFYAKLHEYGLFSARHKERRRNDTGRLLWCSVMRQKDRMKNCIWFQQKYDGMYWHSKGMEWVEKIGPRLTPPLGPGYVAVGKGIPAEYMDPLTEVDWYEQKWQIPLHYGKCLDFWYPVWWVPAGGASWSPYILAVKDWKNKDSWHLFLREKKKSIQ